MKVLISLFWIVVAGNAAIFALIWLERALAAMDGVPESQSHQVRSFAKAYPGCVELGPIDNRDAAYALAERVRSAGGRALVRNRNVLSRPDYVVHVEPLASRDLALRTLRELKDQTINGHVIPDGRLANAVSVGVFGLPAQAEVRRQRVQDLGYQVDVARLERGRTVYSVYADELPAEVPKGVGVTSCGES